MNQLARSAVHAAIKGDWKEAESINTSILNENPLNRDALNRLGRAYLELGKRQQSLVAYKKVLNIDPYNTIAQKAVEKLAKIKNKKRGRPKNGVPNGDTNPAIAFLEEPGKTKTATLIHLGSDSVIASLDTGDKIKLSPHAHRVAAVTDDGHFIGRLPDDLSKRIISLGREGNEYEARIRLATPTCIKIFIRELKRGSKVYDIPSFPSHEKAGYSSFTSPDLVHEEKPETETLEEEDV